MYAAKPKAAGRKARAAEVFDQIDTDGSGSIEDYELLTHLLGQGQDDWSIAELFKALDTNKDGRISREEWDRGFQQYTLSLTEANERGERAEAYHDPRAIWKAMRAGQAILVRASALLRHAGYEEEPVVEMTRPKKPYEEDPSGSRRRHSPQCGRTAALWVLRHERGSRCHTGRSSRRSSRRPS